MCPPAAVRVVVTLAYSGVTNPQQSSLSLHPLASKFPNFLCYVAHHVVILSAFTEDCASTFDVLSVHFHVSCFIFWCLITFFFLFWFLPFIYPYFFVLCAYICFFSFLFKCALTWVPRYFSIFFLSISSCLIFLVISFIFLNFFHFVIVILLHASSIYFTCCCFLAAGTTGPLHVYHLYHAGRFHCLAVMHPSPQSIQHVSRTLSLLTLYHLLHDLQMFGRWCYIIFRVGLHTEVCFCFFQCFSWNVSFDQ